MSEDEQPSGGFWSAVKKAVSRLQDWFVIQATSLKLVLLAIVLLIPATGIYSIVLMQKQAVVAEQVKTMTAAGQPGAGTWSFNEQLPVVFGTGSVLSFLESRPVEQITVIYKPLMWNVSERFILVQSEGKQFAYYPSDMETKIFADKAVSAPWGGKLSFVPRAELTPSSLAMVERLDQRFAGGRPQSEKDGWKAGVSGVMSAALTVGLLGFLAFQLKGQFKSLKFIEPSQVMALLKTWSAWTTSSPKWRRSRTSTCEGRLRGVRHQQAVQRDVQRPAGTGKTKLASYLAKELNLPILFHSAANLEQVSSPAVPTRWPRSPPWPSGAKRCIVFLDEAQDLFMKRGGHRKFDDDTQNTLLAVLDGVRTKSEAEVIWIVASNFNSEQLQMDEAMLRRFQMKVDFRLPNREERLAIINHYLAQRAGKVLPDLDLRHLVELTEGRSPATWKPS
jgi:cell division protease FtsH